jgi:TonB family protein
MSLLLPAASAAAIATALAAAPAAPVRGSDGYERWGEWRVGPGGRESCFAIRDFPGGTRLHLLVKSGGGAGLQLSDRTWTMAPARPYRVTVALDGRRREADWVVLGGGGSGASLHGALEPAFVSDLATARWLEIFAPGGDRLARLDLTGAAGAVYRARGCASGSLPGYAPVPPAPAPPPPPPPTAPPLPNQPPRPFSPHIIGNADYPAAALRAGEEGMVAFTLTVDPSGRATGCAITESSGSALLDSTTCSLLVRRARFRPATDEGGRPVTGTFRSKVIWRLPPPPPPPPPE